MVSDRLLNQHAHVFRASKVWVSDEVASVSLGSVVGILFLATPHFPLRGASCRVIVFPNGNNLLCWITLGTSSWSQPLCVIYLVMTDELLISLCFRRLCVAGSWPTATLPPLSSTIFYLISFGGTPVYLAAPGGTAAWTTVWDMATSLLACESSVIPVACLVGCLTVTKGLVNIFSQLVSALNNTSTFPANSGARPFGFPGFLFTLGASRVAVVGPPVILGATTRFPLDLSANLGVLTLRPIGNPANLGASCISSHGFAHTTTLPWVRIVLIAPLGHSAQLGVISVSATQSNWGPFRLGYMVFQPTWRPFLPPSTVTQPTWGPLRLGYMVFQPTRRPFIPLSTVTQPTWGPFLLGYMVFLPTWRPGVLPVCSLIVPASAAVTPVMPACVLI